MRYRYSPPGKTRENGKRARIKARPGIGGNPGTRENAKTRPPGHENARPWRIIAPGYRLGSPGEHARPGIRRGFHPGGNKCAGIPQGIRGNPTRASAEKAEKGFHRVKKTPGVLIPGGN